MKNKNIINLLAIILTLVTYSVNSMEEKKTDDVKKEKTSIVNYNYDTVILRKIDELLLKIEKNESQTGEKNVDEKLEILGIFLQNGPEQNLFAILTKIEDYICKTLENFDESTTFIKKRTIYYCIELAERFTSGKINESLLCCIHFERTKTTGPNTLVMTDPTFYPAERALYRKNHKDVRKAIIKFVEGGKIKKLPDLGKEKIVKLWRETFRNDNQDQDAKNYLKNQYPKATKDENKIKHIKEFMELIGRTKYDDLDYEENEIKESPTEKKTIGDATITTPKEKATESTKK